MSKIELHERCYNRICTIDNMDINELTFNYKKKVINSFITEENINEFIMDMVSSMGHYTDSSECDQCGNYNFTAELSTNLKLTENDSDTSPTESKASQFRNTNFPPSEADYL